MNPTPLKKIIKEKNLTLRQISKDTKISYHNLSNYSRGIRHAKHETLVQLSNYLNVPIDAILGNVSDDQYVKLSKKDFETVKKLQRQIASIYSKYGKF